jgi:CBS domain-containing protein
MDCKTATAADLMTSPVHVLRAEMDAREAISLFDEQGISGAPVVDSEGDLVGVLSQTDVLHWYLGREDELVVDTDYWHRADLRAQPVPSGFNVVDTNVPLVSDLMTPVTVVATAETPATELAATMVERKVHRIIVTHHGDQVAGIVSALDLLKLVAD